MWKSSAGHHIHRDKKLLPSSPDIFILILIPVWPQPAVTAVLQHTSLFWRVAKCSPIAPLGEGRRSHSEWLLPQTEIILMGTGVDRHRAMIHRAAVKTSSCIRKVIPNIWSSFLHLHWKKHKPEHLISNGLFISLSRGSRRFKLFSNLSPTCCYSCVTNDVLIILAHSAPHNHKNCL